jgi:hypothetical protein
MFFQTVWFQREHGVTLLSVSIIGPTLRSMVKSEQKLTWKPSFWRLATMVRVFVVMKNLLGDLWVIAAVSANGGDNTGEDQSPTLQGENSRSGLSWLCMAMSLLKALFSERGLSPEWKSRVYEWATMARVHYFLLEGIAFGEAVLVLSCWCFAPLQGIDHCSRNFVFIILAFFGYVHLYCHYGTACCRGSIIDTFLILIYAPY